MKKSTNFMAVLSAAAMMCVAAPIVSTTDAYAAQPAGWVEENGSWMYYDADGYYLTDSWKKHGDNWYYLDSEGELAFDTMVDEYYVDEFGKRVFNTWITVDNEVDWDSDEPEHYWYYFGKDGKAVTSKWYNIGENWYYFNSDSQMMTGKVEIDGATYYLGEENDGVMKTGWIQLEEESDNPDEEYVWYYFNSNGKMVENQVDKKIDGAYYTFVNGKMQTGWYKLPVAETAAEATDSNAEAAQTTATVAGYQYYDKENGKRADGWRRIEGAQGISEEAELYNFYFKNGKPFFAETGIQVFTVDSKKYGFNTKGEMQTGLQVVTLDNGNVANFYFGTDGIMKTGKQTIFDEDLGQNQTWFFYTDGSRKGQGFHGVRENNVFKYGLRLEADADLRYAPVTLDDVSYLVNTAGTIQKASSGSKSSEKPELGSGYKDIKDANDKTWVVNTKGIVQ